MRSAIAILIALAAPGGPVAFAQQNTPPLLIPAPPAPTPPPLFVPPPVPSAVTPVPSPSYGVPPGVGSNANVPLSGSSSRVIYRDPGDRKPKKRRWRKPRYQSSVR